MAWLAVNKDGSELIFSEKPKRLMSSKTWDRRYEKYTGRVIGTVINIPKGTIKKILGYELIWSIEPVEIDD